MKYGESLTGINSKFILFLNRFCKIVLPRGNNWRIYLFLFPSFVIVGCSLPMSKGAVLSDLVTISHNPERFADKEVVLKGWGWGWMAKRPPNVNSNLPIAPGFIGLNRNYGTFSDGNYYILIPVSPGYSGRVTIKGRVKLFGRGWTIVVKEVKYEDH